MTRAIAGDMKFGFSLCRTCRVSRYFREDRLRRRHNKCVAVDRRNACRTIWALLAGSLELRITAGELPAFRHAHHAVMLSVAAAARRQIRLALASHRQERLEKRQANQGQQRSGEKSTQCCY